MQQKALSKQFSEFRNLLTVIDSESGGVVSEAKSEGKGSESSEEEEESDPEESEPILIQLLQSMYNRKKTVMETKPLQVATTIEQLRSEFRDILLKERARVGNLERTKQYEKRMRECERLNEMVLRDGSGNLESVGSVIGLKNKRVEKHHPFYLALQAQKKERQKYK